MTYRLTPLPAHRLTIVGILATLLAACASTPVPPVPTLAPTPASTPAPTARAERKNAAPAPQPQYESRLTLADQMSDPVTPPDATLYIDPRNGKVTAQSDRLLRNIADRLKNDDTLLARLESYVPDVGSRAYELGVASRQVETIRQQLIDLGIPRYRVKVAAFGSEHPGVSRNEKNWVDLYIVHVQR